MRAYIINTVEREHPVCAGCGSRRGIREPAYTYTYMRTYIYTYIHSAKEAYTYSAKETY